MYLSRMTLNRQASGAALAPLIDPQDGNEALDAHHRLIWSLFSDSDERERDFLWRSEGNGRFMVLSSRRPVAGDLFAGAEIKSFQPVLKAGNRLGFALRVSATKQKTGGGRIDVVRAAMQDQPADQRDIRPMDVAQTAGHDWLARQGERLGFSLDESSVDNYRFAIIPAGRGRRRGKPQFGILDIAGTLTVTDPSCFVDALGAGIGRARAFGCGLMLIRRA